MTRLPDTSTTSITMDILATNRERRLRFFLRLNAAWLWITILTSANWSFSRDSQTLRYSVVLTIAYRIVSDSPNGIIEHHKKEKNREKVQDY